MSYTTATTYLLAFMPDDSVMAPQYMGFATEESARDSDFLRKAISMGVSDRYNGGRLDLIKTVVWSNSKVDTTVLSRFVYNRDLPLRWQEIEMPEQNNFAQVFSY